MPLRRTILFWLSLLTQLSNTQPVASQAFASDGLVNHYTVERASTAINIDGHLDEFAWESAAQINSFDRILSDYNLVLHPTRARMLWDDENFYFTFVCQDSDMWAIYENEDDKLWEEEVVEVFIDPDGDGGDYLELEVNPNNMVVDLNILQLKPTWEADMDWDIDGLQTAVFVHGTVNDSLSQDLGWTVEIAIPWAAMTAGIGGGHRPEPGDTWRLNLYRIERQAGRNAMSQIRSLQTRIEQMVRDSGADSSQQMTPELQKKHTQLQKRLSRLSEHSENQTEYTAWSETYERGFHHPDRFGIVRFAE